MKLVRGAWKLLVGIKDGLVLLFMLLFFGLLFAALAATPNPGAVTPGALLVDLEGVIVEQPAETDPFAAVTGSDVMRENRLRDVIHALETAATDSRVKVVVLDLDRFSGGGQVALADVGAAIDKVRATKKPVLAYATGYTDDGYQLAAHASEIWLNPLGAALFTGPGGSQLYYKGLIDKLGVTTHVYKVGVYKSAVEPYLRADQSPEAKQANQALADSLWAGWQAEVAKARPKAKLAQFIAAPDEALKAQGNDLTKAAVAAGIVDKLGDRTAFGKRVAEIAGASDDGIAGRYKHTKLANWLAANPAPTSGDAIGIVTVAGVISDGEAGPGSAGGDTISKLILNGIAKKKLKALVVRIDSPGGSALASEQIRSALLEAKATGLPIVVSMGSVAASGGYWISTAGDQVFAEPGTITGSIGVFGVFPTLENALAKIGVTSDGVGTTPLSGQPDIYGGTTPQFDAVMQAGVETIYGRFLAIVSAARKLPTAEVDRIGQGRVWDGGTARQLKLVDSFGSLDAAVAEAARRAKIKDPAKVQRVYLEKPPSVFATLMNGFSGGGEEDDAGAPAADLLTRMSRERMALAERAVADARLLTEGSAIQARCLECGHEPARYPSGRVDLFTRLLAGLYR